MSKTNDTHKTNDTPKLGHGTFEDRTLDDKELDAVTGGIYADASHWVSNQTMNVSVRQTNARRWPY